MSYPNAIASGENEFFVVWFYSQGKSPSNTTFFEYFHYFSFVIICANHRFIYCSVCLNTYYFKGKNNV